MIFEASFRTGERMVTPDLRPILDKAWAMGREVNMNIVIWVDNIVVASMYVEVYNPNFGLN